MIAAAGFRSASARRRGRLALSGPSVFIFAAAGAGVAGLSAFSGGYYPQSWGVAGLACLAVALGSLLWSRSLGLSPSAWSLLAALAGLAAWMGVSALRPGAATLAVPELERTALYVIVVWAGLVASRCTADAAEALVAGLLVGIVVVCLRGLELFLFPRHAAPDLYEGRLLFQPLGYANAMGILAAIGFLLAFEAACHGSSSGSRALAAGALTPLAATLWFTQSVGAAAALVAGGVAMVALDPFRRRLVTTAVVAFPLPLIVVWVASRSPVGDSQASTSAVVRSGHLVAAVLVLVTLASASIAFVLLRRDRLGRIQGPALVLAASAVIAGIAVIAVMGAKGVALGDRIAYWRAALADIGAHPLLGSGAGSYEIAWLRYRASPVPTLDAHNLYLETLAELGPLGLALLLGALFLPLRSLSTRPRRPAPVAAGAAYVAFLVHAFFDWDWEMPAVAVTGFLCGVALVVDSKHDPTLRRVVRRRSTAIALVVTLACVLPVTAELIGNQMLAAAQHAAVAGDWKTAERRARAASIWQPWSSQPPLLLGLGQVATGNLPAARENFARAVRLDPTNTRGWYELGSVGGPRTRSEALHRLLALDPIGTRSR